MALSSEDRTEIQLLILQNVEKLLHESNGFADARRAVDKRRQELEADLRDINAATEKRMGCGRSTMSLKRKVSAITGGLSGLLFSSDEKGDGGMGMGM